MTERSLEKLVHSAYEDLLSIDNEGILYDDPSSVTDLLAPRIIDGTTLSAIDVRDLFEAVNHTKTRIGAATLFRSLVRPLDSLDLILEKQNLVRDLGENRRLRKALNDYLAHLSRRNRTCIAICFSVHTFKASLTVSGTSISTSCTANQPSSLRLW